jgi:hypothetical protein
MFVLFIRRAIKVNTNATAKFAPRSANHEVWKTAGPFSSKRNAERAMLAAMSTHTCIGAVIVARDDCDDFMHKNDWNGSMNEVRRLVAAMK